MSDPNPQGGSLSDMAVQGTTVPSDSAKPRTIPSVPRPGQITDPTDDSNNLGSSDLAGAADNAQDMPRVPVSPYDPIYLRALPLTSLCCKDDQRQSSKRRGHHRHRRRSSFRSRLQATA